MKQIQGLSWQQIFLMGGALFAMHFGGASMIWPMTWGKESGSSVLLAFSGIFITALLLPLLAYVALSRGQGSFLTITRRALPTFGHFFCGATIMVLGPLFVIPRMSAASWDVILQVTGWQPTSGLPVLLFSCAYYLLTYWFVFSRAELIGKISKILFPALILIVTAIVSKGLWAPINATQAAPSYSIPPVLYGFTEGYATGDLLCGLVFGVIILNNLKRMGLPASQLKPTVIKVGCVGIGILTTIHLGHMLVGSYAGSLEQLKYATLYAQVVLHLWGSTGGIFFSVALIFAALTTAIGLTAATAEYFEEASHKRLPYKGIAIAVLSSSTIIGSIGLEQIVAIFAPLLDAFYPGAILLTLYYAFVPNCFSPKGLNGLRYAVIASFTMGLLDVAFTYNGLFSLELQAFVHFYQSLPLSAYKLTWVPVALLCGLLGSLRRVELPLVSPQLAKASITHK